MKNLILLIIISICLVMPSYAGTFRPDPLPERSAPVEVWDKADKRQESWDWCIQNQLNRPMKQRMFGRSSGWSQTREILAYIISKDCKKQTDRLVLAYKEVGYTPNEVTTWFVNFVDDFAWHIEEKAGRM